MSKSDKSVSNNKLTARQQQSLGNRLTRHAKNNCANFLDGGECPLYDICIVQAYSRSHTDNFTCSYFEQSVLPSDAALENDYNMRYKQSASNESIKSCTWSNCNNQFIPTSNRQKYCSSECARLARNSKNKAQMKERRLQEQLNNKNN